MADAPKPSDSAQNTSAPEPESNDKPVSQPESELAPEIEENTQSQSSEAPSVTEAPPQPQAVATQAVTEQQSTAEAVKQRNDISQRLMKLSLRRFARSVGDLFHLRDEADEEGTVNDIKRSIEFRGANLWALVFAIFIASVGLNTNSAAVIIGAMLISPLMGPIMGVGLALGTNDIDLLKRSLRNLGIAVTISVMTSALYFLITPLDQAQSELLARTRPTIFDVLIALFGGSIGIIASSRKEKTNAIPGVAIATALMPPLCTAGYGLANFRWSFFLGAIYLFFINSVFICVTTFIFVRFLKFKRVSFVDEAREQRVKYMLAAFALVTIIPSVFAAVEVVNETLFQTRASQFVAQSFKFEETQLIKAEYKYNRHGSEIWLTLMGEPLRQREQLHLEGQLPVYQLAGTHLILKQPSKSSSDLEREFTEMNQNLRTEIVQDLYKKNEELLLAKDIELKDKEKQIKSLEQELLKLKSDDFPTSQVLAEVQLQYPQLESLVLEETQRFTKDKAGTFTVALVHWKDKVDAARNQKLQALLRIRLKNATLQVLSY